MDTFTNSYTLLSVPDLYPYVLALATAISFLCFTIGMFMAGSKRSKLFTAEKLKQKFGEQHQAAFGRDPPKGGYPDHGNGLYSDLLSYKEWMEFKLD